MTNWRPPGLLAGVFVLALAIQVFAGVVSYRTTDRLIEQSGSVQHTFEVLSTLGSLWAQLADVDASARGFMLAGEEQFLEPYNASLSEISKDVAALRALTADNSRQQRRLDTLEPLISQRLAIITKRIEIRRTEGLAAVGKAVRAGHGQNILLGIRTILREIETEENDTLRSREASARSAASAAIVTAMIGTSLSMTLVLGVFILLNREVRQRQQAAEQERRALRLVDATRDGVFMFDPETLRFFYVNQGAMDQTGYSREELLTMTPLDIKPEFDPPAFRRMLAPLLAGASTAHTFTTVHRRKDGHDLPVEIVLQCVDLDSGNRNMLAVARDVTERRRLEEERDRFFNLSLDMICVAGFDGCFKQLNPAWEKTLGFTVEELLCHPYLDFIHPEDRERTAAEALRQAAGKNAISFENRYLCKDGSYKWFLWNATPLPARQLIYAVAHDITERKRDEEAVRSARDLLEQRTAQLEASNKELEAFTYSVSHDLRSPLRHVDGFSKILLEEFQTQLDPEAQRYLERIRAGTQQMGHLVDDLLNLARMSRQEMKLQVSGLKSIVQEVVADLKPEAANRQIEWRCGELPFVECDPALIKQVFANLLSNALKFTRTRERAVIEVGNVKQNGRSAVFVRDNGVGFNMKYSDKLFGVFQRLHRQEDFEGTGVGLATVQRIIHKHGGQVWAEAELDKGATFFFTLASATNPGSATQNTAGGKP